MTFDPDTARAWVDIDPGAIARNARTLLTLSGSRLLPMIKANGYGLGAVAVARALEPLSPWGFGVGSVEEGRQLRAAGVERPILVVSPLLPASIDDYLADDLRPAVGDVASLAAWCGRSGLPFHLEIDSGMGRAGLRWDASADLEAARTLLRDADGWEGAFTHFHSADTDPPSAVCQWDRFLAVLEMLPRRPAFVHAANSAAALRGRTFAGDLIRPGIFLYGGAAGGADSPSPEPVAAFRSRVVAVRRLPAGASVSYGADWRAPQATTIATLAVGYGDGLLRASAPGGPPPARSVELDGAIVPLTGRVTMDLTMADCGDRPVRPGDVATIFGGRITLDTQAAACGTIAYELLTALSARVPRRYRRTG